MTTKEKGISAKEVSELRQRTGAGMMDCKKALEETKGDMDAAVEHLRKTGAAKAEKRAGREVREGLVGDYIHFTGKIGVLVGSVIAGVLASLVLLSRNAAYRRIHLLETADADHDGVPDIYESQQD